METNFENAFIKDLSFLQSPRPPLQTNFWKQFINLECSQQRGKIMLKVSKICSDRVVVFKYLLALKSYLQADNSMFWGSKSRYPYAYSGI